MRCRGGWVVWCRRFSVACISGQWPKLNEVVLQKVLKLDRFLKTVFSLIFRAGLLLAGLVVLASLFLAAGLLLAVWSLRALWAKLTGRPVQPWAFHVNRQAMWNRFYRAPGQAPGAGRSGRNDADVIDADVTDVEPKAIKPPEA